METKKLYNKIDNIVIVGGGSAGWMSATHFLNTTKAKITLVESPNHPTVGVGAGYIRSTHPQKFLRIDAKPIFTKTMIFEGDNEDSNETILTVTEPTSDNIITFPDATGTVALTSDITGTTGYATSSIFSTSVSLTIYDSTGTAVKTIFGSTT